MLFLKKIGWSFVVKYRFDEFIKFCHDCSVVLEKDMKRYPILIKEIEISSIGFTDSNRGHYVVVFDILDSSDIQLTLF